ncbi:MAG: MotA/TolQ/ExbB proton channel family protein [Candidatus Cloacimonetes bacterium]|nr:MotA/TolQ/ExbB proton channel family protein [Candidatus Cloacimonadota bacterium]
MFVLLLISVIAIGIIIEKYLQLKRVRKANAALRDSLGQQQTLEGIRSALASSGSASPLGIMLDKLFNSSTTKLELLSQSMESSANLQLHELEKGLGWLSTFAAIAPLIGFLGTVIGMVRVFMKIQLSSQTTVDISMLSGGIWEALLTTIGGLVVGIPMIIFYNDLVQKLENIVKDMQDSAVEYTIKFQELNPGGQ